MWLPLLKLRLWMATGGQSGWWWRYRYRVRYQVCSSGFPCVSWAPAPAGCLHPEPPCSGVWRGGIPMSICASNSPQIVGCNIVCWHYCLHDPRFTYQTCVQQPTLWCQLFASPAEYSTWNARNGCNKKYTSIFYQSHGVYVIYRSTSQHHEFVGSLSVR